MLGLERHGWRRSKPETAGIQFTMERDLPGDGAVYLNLDPGIVIGANDEFVEQTLAGISVSSGHFTRELHLRDLDPVIVSELIRDLEELTM